MRWGKAVAWVQAGIVAVSLALPPSLPAPPVTLGIAAAVATVVASPDDAAARSSSSSSSRGSSSSYSRSSSSSSSSSRTPSYSSFSRSDNAARSSSDVAASRQNSGKALDAYRQSKEPAAPATPGRSTIPDSGNVRTPSSGSVGSGSSNWGQSGSAGSSWTWNLGGNRRPAVGGYGTPYPAGAYPGWTPPAYAAQGPRSFGLWDAAMLWFLLDTLNRPGHAAFFHDNSQDPGYKEWRGQADKLAQDNPDLKNKLNALDAQMAAQAGDPIIPGRVPADLVPAAAAADGKTAESGSSWLGWLLTLIVLALVAYGLYKVYTMFSRLFGTAKAVVSSRVDHMTGAKPDTPARPLDAQGKRSPFRVGQTVTLEPTPFLLAAGKIKTALPDGVGPGGGMTSAESVSTLVASSLTLHRLYLGENEYLQIHLNADGQPDECRYFQIQEIVEPADKDEWATWLDDKDGLIGEPDFTTPDNTTYRRVWSPGSRHVAPMEFDESQQTTHGAETARYSAMLYRIDTGLQAPAPTVEYLLVSAIESGDAAWVEIASGIDINPASLSLT